MKWFIPIGRLLDVPLRVHIFVPLLVLLVAAVSPKELPAVNVFLGAFLLILSIITHELGHTWMAGRHGVPVQVILLHPFGGAAVMGKHPPHPKASLQIALAGPVASLLLALLGWIGTLFTTAVIFEHLLLINGLIGVFNLMPAFPLDGGRALHALLNMRLPTKTATRWTAHTGRALAVLSAVALAFSGQVFMGGVVLILLFKAASSEERSTHVRLFMSEQTVHDTMDSVPEVLNAGSPIQDAARLMGLYPHMKALPVMFGERIIGVIHRRQLLEYLRAPFAKESNVLIDRNIITQSSNISLMELLEKMTSHHSYAAVITEDGEVCGVLTIDRLEEAIQRAAP